MEKQIAILADPELVDAMRLAGIRRTRALRAHGGAAAAIGETLREWLATDEIGVIIIGADHAALARELISGLRRGKRISPVIIEVPSRDGAWQADAVQYYQRLGREFLGLEIVLQEEALATGDTQSGTA
jgi:vacuolar-type H+-ATPase subunit F/Vma7